MAKRAPAGEAAYNPLDESLAYSVIKPSIPYRDGNDHAARTSKSGATSVRAEFVPSRAPEMTALRGFTRAKRVLLTPEEERDIQRLVDRLAEQLGASLKLSHVLRACMAVLCHAEAEILRQAHATNPLARPANGDAVALAQFEQTVARLFSLALRDAPPLR